MLRGTSVMVLAAMTLVGAAGCSQGQSEEPADQVAADAGRPRSLLDLEKKRRAALEESPLKADRERYDFGRVPIGGGDVETTFTVSNAGSGPADLVSVFTSCGCTTAVLEFADGSRAGPFGMPGHGLATRLERASTLEPGESVTLHVTFDPAAHGPAGLGAVTRVVNVHTADGGGLQVRIAAQVVRS